MDLQLRDRVALLLGGSRGIGGATALALAQEGAQLALVARDSKTLEERAARCREAGSPRVLTIAADVTDTEQLRGAIEAVSKAFGRLDILITLVGGSAPGGTDAPEGVWHEAFERNLWPAVRASRMALPLLLQSAARAMSSRSAPSGEQPKVRSAVERPAVGGDEGTTGTLPMQEKLFTQTGLKVPPEVPASICGPVERGGSVIVHVASIWGREGGGPMTYNAAKAALVSLAHAQAKELAPQGVRVLSVAPGSTLHPGGSWERRLQKDPQGTTAFVQREIPFGRFGTAEELGEVIAFLCSPRASWVAGTCVVIDGAQSHGF